MASHDFKVDWQGEASNDAGSGKKSSSSSGAWQSLGVSPKLVRALNLRGFKTPTPIQRASLPTALSTPPRDVLGMARTGSGKTLAYLVPLLERLGGTRKEGVGMRALILCPARELALQVLKVGKDLARSLATGPQALSWSLVMGGESLEAQFEAMSSNPDIVIATPGRLLHLAVEMDLDLRSVEVVIYDEADRLFEMGFEQQLREILHRLPANRHSLLFSATLPSSLAEFAKAGLHNPQFIRLDTEHRISPDLKVAFFSVKPDEKDAALLVLLREVIKIPTASEDTEGCPRAIVFASTKHHVEYLSVLLGAAGYRASYIYGSLDQVARQQQLRHFRDGNTELLIVTDVAARGLDIPAMGHVINFDFPSGVRVFVHRVGRTARAGQQGHAWTLVTRDDVPYLRDLETFLERPLINDNEVFGAPPRDSLESTVEYVNQSLDVSAPQLPSLREVMARGQSMFERSRSKASREAYKTAKAVQAEAFGSQAKTHPAFEDPEHKIDAATDARRQDLLASIYTYNPSETIFEIGVRGQQATTVLMKQRRQTIAQHRARSKPKANEDDGSKEDTEITPAVLRPTSAKRSYRDPNFFLAHENVETNRDKGYSLSEGASFAEQARGATLDLNGDEGEAQRVQKASQLKWDRKRKRFVKGDGIGSNNEKMIRSESGALLPASFKSGRFDDWKKRNKNGSTVPTSSTHRHSRTAGASRSSGRELATAETILKDRRDKLNRKQKTGRPSKKRS